MTAPSVPASLRPLLTPVSDLTSLAGNPRRGDVEAVSRSYAEFGQRKPIVARKTGGTPERPIGIVIAGNHQLEAAKGLGWDSIAVVWVEEDETRAKAYALADNRIGDLGIYDEDDLTAMLSEVFEEDPELLEATGFSADELDDLLAEANALPETQAQTFTGDYIETPEAAQARHEESQTKPNAGTYAARGLREVILVYPQDVYDEYISALVALKKAHGSDVSSSDLVLKAVREAADRAQG